MYYITSVNCDPMRNCLFLRAAIVTRANNKAKRCANE